MAMGALGLAMVGMTALAPGTGSRTRAGNYPGLRNARRKPVNVRRTLLACDMGGFFLAKELAGGDVAAWLYSGLILGSMMGQRLWFSIPWRSALSNLLTVVIWRSACWRAL
ncbi:putative ethanolamine transporter [Escherichia coli]|uniref:Putative ethanolamine transporter n=1 Tax=Escherichia coli TaxID=562 RepID=A0A377C7J7_ECOLX|nr:putative ethanolamine transporter [Escherichia coli]